MIDRAGIEAVRQRIARGEIVSCLWHGLTPAGRRWLARQIKAGRVYRRTGIGADARWWPRVSYFVRADLAPKLDADNEAQARRFDHALALDRFAAAERWAAHRTGTLRLAEGRA